MACVTCRRGILSQSTQCSSEASIMNVGISRFVIAKHVLHSLAPLVLNTGTFVQKSLSPAHRCVHFSAGDCFDEEMLILHALRRCERLCASGLAQQAETFVRGKWRSQIAFPHEYPISCCRNAQLHKEYMQHGEKCSVLECCVTYELHYAMLGSSGKCPRRRLRSLYEVGAEHITTVLSCFR